MYVSINSADLLFASQEGGRHHRGDVGDRGRLRRYKKIFATSSHSNLCTYRLNSADLLFASQEGGRHHRGDVGDRARLRRYKKFVATSSHSNLSTYR